MNPEILQLRKELTELQRQFAALMNPEILQLRKELTELQRQFAAFQNLAQLDPQIIKTISAAANASILVSDKLANSENQNVNEAGAASYPVLKPPDRFVLLGGQNIPAYDL